MTFEISDIEYKQISHRPLDGPATKMQGPVAAATFTCTCGHTWRATATPRSLAAGQFALTHSSITVNCPGTGCNLQWTVTQGRDY